MSGRGIIMTDVENAIAKNILTKFGELYARRDLGRIFDDDLFNEFKSEFYFRCAYCGKREDGSKKRRLEREHLIMMNNH